MIIMRANKLAKKGSASSQSDYQKIDRIPENLYDCINQALEAEQKLKRCTSDEGLLKQFNYLKEMIGSLAEFYKEIGLLPSDWEYHPDSASSYVPKCPLVSAKKKLKKNIPRNPHIDSAPLVGEPAKAKAARRNYKKLDEKFKANKLAKNHSASSQSDYQKIDRVTPSKEAPELEIPETVYFYVKRALKAEQELKTRPSDEQAVEQGKSGAYEINLRCNLDDGAIVLDSFCLKGPEPLGTREGAFISLESIYETVK
ncbi:hypothetical protein Tco_1206724, partial [Tanacetum coccineum]